MSMRKELKGDKRHNRRDAVRVEGKGEKLDEAEGGRTREMIQQYVQQQIKLQGR